MARIIGAIFDIRSATAGAVVMSTVVLLANLDHGFASAFIAAAKQAAYTFLFSGPMVAFCRWGFKFGSNKLLRLFYGVFLPALLTSFLVFELHSFRGTPEPFRSTIPVIILSIAGFYVVGYRSVYK